MASAKHSLLLAALSCAAVLADARPQMPAQPRRETVTADDAARRQLAILRGGFVPTLPALNLPTPSTEKVVDGALAGAGIALTFLIMSALEQVFGTALVAAPMMAIALIFFAAASLLLPRPTQRVSC